MGIATRHVLCATDRRSRHHRHSRGPSARLCCGHMVRACTRDARICSSSLRTPLPPTRLILLSHDLSLSLSPLFSQHPSIATTAILTHCNALPVRPRCTHCTLHPDRPHVPARELRAIAPQALIVAFPHAHTSFARPAIHCVLADFNSHVLSCGACINYFCERVSKSISSLVRLFICGATPNLSISYSSGLCSCHGLFYCLGAHSSPVPAVASG